MADIFVIYARFIGDDLDRPIGSIEGKECAGAVVDSLQYTWSNGQFRTENTRNHSAPKRRVIEDQIVAARRGERSFEYFRAARHVAKLQETLESDESTIEQEETGKRPAFDRDHLWLKWNEEEGLKPAAIRDRWNGMTDAERKGITVTTWQKIGAGNSGRAVVYDALKRAKREK